MGEGKALQELIRKKNITATKLSRETGISSNTLYAIFKRDSKINTTSLAKIADALEMSVGELTDALSEDDNEHDSISDTRLLDAEINQTFTDMRKLLVHLNALTIEYEERIKKRLYLQDHIKALKERMEKEQLEIYDTENEMQILENDILNRQLELSLIRKKLSESDIGDIYHREKPDTSEE